MTHPVNQQNPFPVVASRNLARTIFGTIEFAEPGHAQATIRATWPVADKLDAADSCFLFRLVDVNVSAELLRHSLPIVVS